MRQTGITAGLLTYSQKGVLGFGGNLLGYFNIRSVDVVVGAIQIQQAHSTVAVNFMSAGGCIETNLGEKFGKVRFEANAGMSHIFNGEHGPSPEVFTASAGVKYVKKVGTAEIGISTEAAVGYSSSPDSSNPETKVDKTVTTVNTMGTVAF